MASTRRLAQLTALIQENTAKVDESIQKQGLPEPSFDASYPPVLMLPPEAEEARHKALEALDELREHLLSPLGSILDQVQDLADLVGLNGVTHFGLANNLPLGETMSIPELAKKSNMHPDDATVIIRQAASRRILKVSKDGNVEHTAGSVALVVVPGVRELCRNGLYSQWRAAPYIVEAMEKWPGTQDLDQTAYSLGHRTDLRFFEHMEKTGDQAKYFAETMKLLAQAPHFAVDYVLEYDWSQHGAAKVVDIGGNTGTFALRITEKHPDLKFVVQDRPEIVAMAEASATENVSFMAHDFFKPQPIHDADVYFMRWIMHDWPDKFCVQILQALIPALKPKARVVIMDAIVPEPGEATPYQERKIRDFDIVMKSLTNSKERTESDWRKLVAAASEEGKFKVAEIIRPKGSQLGFLVLEWQG